MIKRDGFLRTVVILALLVYLQALVLPGIVQAQTADCPFDKENPTIANARYNFKITNYDCAELELKTLLANETLELETKADAHVLLASVYYAKVRDNEQKREMVIGQFVAAFKAFRAWQGDLDVQSPEFLEMMEQAQELVDQEGDEAAVTEEVDEQVVEQEVDGAPVTVITEDKKKGPWYKQWWAIGLGVGLVATAVVVAGGGGDDGGEEPGEPLPDFPDPPAKK
jgi:hypothetical protein